MRYSDYIGNLKTKIKFLEKDKESLQEINSGLENIIQERETSLLEIEERLKCLLRKRDLNTIENAQ